MARDNSSDKLKAYVDDCSTLSPPSSQGADAHMSDFEIHHLDDAREWPRREIREPPFSARNLPSRSTPAPLPALQSACVRVPDSLHQGWFNNLRLSNPLKFTTAGAAGEAGDAARGGAPPPGSARFGHILCGWETSRTSEESAQDDLQAPLAIFASSRRGRRAPTETTARHQRLGRLSILPPD